MGKKLFVFSVFLLILPFVLSKPPDIIDLSSTFCSDTDGLNFESKGSVYFGDSNSQNTAYDSCSGNLLSEQYCVGDSKAIKPVNCVSDYDACIDGACVLKKDLSKYSSKEVFLVSGDDWRTVLSFVPVAVWTNSQSSVVKYPFLIYHSELSSIDIDSTIHFLQLYAPDKVTIIGTPSQDLANLLVADNSVSQSVIQDDPNSYLGAGLQSSQISSISASSYLAFWNDYDSVVVVDYDNYDDALMASVLASYLNSPLLLLNGVNVNSYQSAFSGKKVYLVGSVDSSVSNSISANAILEESFSTQDLLEWYASETNTDKAILVNSADLSEPTIRSFQPDRTANPVSNILYKHSLAAPVLASGKHELIINEFHSGILLEPSCNSLNPNVQIRHDSIKSSLQQTISDIESASNVDIEYLTIISSPQMIPDSIQKPCSGLDHDRISVDKEYVENSIELDLSNIYDLPGLVPKGELIDVSDSGVVLLDGKNQVDSGVYTFDNSLNYLSTIGSYGLDPGEFHNLHDIEIQGNSVFTLNFHSSSNEKLMIEHDLNGNFIQEWVLPNSQSSSYFGINFDITDDGKFFVLTADQLPDANINIYDASGNLISTLPQSFRLNWFGASEAMDSVISEGDNIHVLNDTFSGNSRIYTFDSDGNELSSVLLQPAEDIINHHFEFVGANQNHFFFIYDKDLWIDRNPFLISFDKVTGLEAGRVSIPGFFIESAVYSDSLDSIVVSLSTNFLAADANIQLGSIHSSLLTQRKENLVWFGEYNGPSVGRIYGVSVSDTSSYISRSLFYNQIFQELYSSNFYSGMFIGSDDGGTGGRAHILNNIKNYKDTTEASGFTSECFTCDWWYKTSCDLGAFRDGCELKTGPSNNQFYKYNKKQIITYEDHGFQSGWGGTLSSYAASPEYLPWFDLPFVFGIASLTNQYWQDTTQEYTFSQYTLRRGAMAYYGSSASGGAFDWESTLRMMKLLTSSNDYSSGEIFKLLFFWNEDCDDGGFCEYYSLIGDPTLIPISEEVDW